MNGRCERVLGAHGSQSALTNVTHNEKQQERNVSAPVHTSDSALSSPQQATAPSDLGDGLIEHEDNGHSHIDRFVDRVAGFCGHRSPRELVGVRHLKRKEQKESPQKK